MMTVEEMYDYLMDVVGVEEQTLSVACSLCGYNTDTMNRVLYALTGYNSVEQYREEMEEEMDNE